MVILCRSEGYSGGQTTVLWAVVIYFRFSSQRVSEPCYGAARRGWSFALYAFLHSHATTPQRVALLLSMIAAHAWRTVQTVGYARSQRSNHLFSEAVGLWTAGTLYPELKDAVV